MFKDLSKSLYHQGFHIILRMVLQSKVVCCIFFVFCISSDCTLMLGIVDLRWLGFVGKVRSEGLEGRAQHCGLHRANQIP